MLTPFIRHASVRKVRLAAVNFAARVKHLAGDERSHQALDIAERYADGLATEAELAEARRAVKAAFDAHRKTAEPGRTGYGGRPLPGSEGLEAVPWTPARRAAHGARSCSLAAAMAAAQVGAKAAALGAARMACLATASAFFNDRLGPNPSLEAAMRPERKEQAALLHDLLGNPFRTVEVEPGWLAWHGGAPGNLAAAVYEERELPSGRLDAARLAILADMLEEAGATDPHLLGHLRSPGPHVRGCAAVDALIGRS
jgi:hypothetical protein